MAIVQNRRDDLHIRAFIRELQEEFDDLKISEGLDRIEFRFSENMCDLKTNVSAVIGKDVLRRIYAKLTEVKTCAVRNRKRIETRKERSRKQAKLRGLIMTRARRGW